jgi:hypothetical protein
LSAAGLNPLATDEVLENLRCHICQCLSAIDLSIVPKSVPYAAAGRQQMVMEEL